MWNTRAENLEACRLHGYQGCNTEAAETREASTASISQYYGKPVRVGGSDGQLQEMAETLSTMVNRSVREWEGLYRHLRDTAATLHRHAAPSP